MNEMLLFTYYVVSSLRIRTDRINWCLLTGYSSLRRRLIGDFCWDCHCLALSRRQLVHSVTKIECKDGTSVASSIFSRLNLDETHLQAVI